MTEQAVPISTSPPLSSESETVSSACQSRIYYPSPRDILHVSALLASTPLPPELIDTVLEQAEYWASITARLDPGLTDMAKGQRREHVRLLRCKPLCSGAADEGCFVQGKGEQRVGSVAVPDEGNGTDGRIEMGDEGTANTVVIGEAETRQGSRARHYANLSADRILEPRSKFPARRITWRIQSRDQGWGGEGGDTYEKSWTGFRGSVLRYKSVGRTGDGDGKEEFRLSGSKEYLRAWELLDKKDSAEAQTDNDGEFVAEGDNDEERIWPRGEWHFGPTRIQVNARADRQLREHVVVWDFRDNLDASDHKVVETLLKIGRGPLTGAGMQVRALQRGDIVELHSYAFFGGWENIVDTAEVRIEFAL